MNTTELQEIVLRTAAELSHVRNRVDDLGCRDERVEIALAEVRRRLANCLRGFDRDKYKSTDYRLAITDLASELLIFDKLGYELASPGSRFLLGVAALLRGRCEVALEYLVDFLGSAALDDPNVVNAHYLAGMICYNRREFARASEHFESAFRLSPEDNRDWQARIYVAELLYFMRKEREEIEKSFSDLEEGLKVIDDHPQHSFWQTTLYLKLGNCYVETFLKPRERNAMVNTPIAVGYYKQARRWCPRIGAIDSLLPVIVDFSLAQALIILGSVDMDLVQTPSELLVDVFHRLRRLVLHKREEIILAQCYFMLAICAYYAAQLPKDHAEIYLEYARHQTLTVPSDVCFYSCITKELLPRNDFVRQIDYYAEQLKTTHNRR